MNHTTENDWSFECETCGRDIWSSETTAHQDWHYERIALTRDGSRGHYLTALLIDDAYDLATALIRQLIERDDARNDDLDMEHLLAAAEWIRDYRRQLAALAIAEEVDYFRSATYAYEATEDHAELFHDWANDAESALGNMGYAVDSDDGYAIWTLPTNNETVPGEVTR